MLQFVLTIECDNAAFEELATEVARILNDTARRVEHGELINPVNLLDVNGNRVGTARFIWPGE